jgi:REP element-mobilizing transposase RayT
MNHVHFLVNIPKKYSVQTAEMLSEFYRVKMMFENVPRFRKDTCGGGL